MTPISPAVAGSARPAQRRSIPVGTLRGIAGFAVFLGLLELLPRLGVVNPRYVPPLTEILGSLLQQATGPAFWIALPQTLQGWAIGLAIALVLGILLGVVLGKFSLVRQIAASTIEFLRPIPSVALIPLAVLMFGAKPQSTLVLVVYASLWPILLQVIRGIQDVDPVARDTALSYGLGRVTRILRLDWPSALPYAMTGFRLSASVALILEITGELIIGSPGLGQLIAVAQSSGAVAAMYALVAVTGLLGLAMNVFARAAETRMMHWHPSIRRDLGI